MERKTCLQLIYLGTSLFSWGCLAAHYNIIACSNIVGCMCFVDFFFTERNDMLAHHSFVLALLHYMNTHQEIENRNDIVSVALSTEISTIFLTMNNLLERSPYETLKILNKTAFVVSFMYYRIYKFAWLVADERVHTSFLVHSKNSYEYGEIYVGLYGLFLLNVYWLFLIFKKMKKARKEETKIKSSITILELK